MFTNQWDPFIPYTPQDVREFISAGIDGVAIQRIRFERDRKSLFTADLFLHHRRLRRRMVWQFITLDVRNGHLHIEFPTPFRELPPAWNNLFAQAFSQAFSALQRHPQGEQGFILTVDFPTSGEVSSLTDGGENRVAPGFAWNELYVHSAKRYLFAAERVQDMRVLDLGCGVGYGAKILARRAAHIVAADVDEHPLRYGEETYPDPKIVRAHIAPVREGQDLPFETGAFDAVVCFEVIEHVPVEQMEAFFAEVARVLRPDGAVILSTPNKHIYIHYPDPHHVSLMTLEEFRRLLESRFRQVQVLGQVRSRGLPHTAMEFEIVPTADDGQEIYVAMCREYIGDQRPIALPPPTVWENVATGEPVSDHSGDSSQERLPVSVIVHTRNEEQNIAECLECVKGWAAEIIVMDMESSDRTVEIARQYTDKVYSHPLVRDFDIARNESAKYATQPWVLYVDADERVPSAFADALREILPGLDESVAGICVAIKNYFLGKWIRHAGKWYPAYNAPRLLRRGRFQWLPAAHQGVKVQGQVKYMPPDREEWAFEHFTTPSLNHYLVKLNRYSDSAAHRMFREGAPCSWQTLAAAMGYAFRFYYDATEGYKDGAHGFLLALGSALSALVDQMKYAELLLREGHLQEEEFLPPSGEAFFQLVADVAAGRVPVEQKYLSQILRVGAPLDAEPPAWWHRLWQRIQRQAGGIVYCSVDFPQTDGWRSWQEDEADALIVFGTEWKRHVRRLREGGSFFIGIPSFPEDALRWRAEIENAFGGTAHLIDPESECPWLFVFGWKGQRVSARRRVLMTTHQRALHMLGGGETQLLETLLALREQGVVADLSVSLRLPKEGYDLIHAFSLYHTDKVEALEQIRQPLVVSTIFRDNSAFYPVAVASAIFRHEEEQQVKELLRAWKEGRLQAQVDGPGVLDEPEPLKGVKRRIVQRANLLLPNCDWELGALRRYFRLGDKAAQVVPNAVRPERFLQAQPDAFVQRFGLRDFVLCAARIEPLKNQLMLLWALRDLDIPVVLAGKVSDSEYGELCYRWANDRAHFVGELEPDLLASAYAAARVHAMPSWAETPGLTSMEAALAGCSIVVGNQGAEREYFGDFAYYCNPADVDSVREAVLQAWEDRDAAKREAFREYILTHYTWDHTARATAEAYERVLQGGKTCFCIPDWNEPYTWQPVVRRYLEEHGHGDGALLQLYAGGFNAFRAEDAFALLEQYVLSLGVNPEECADIEVVDFLPENFLGRVLLTGSRYDSVARARYSGQCERAPDRAA